MDLKLELKTLLAQYGRQVSVEGREGSAHKALLFPCREDEGEGYRIAESGRVESAAWRYYAAAGEGNAGEHEVLLCGGRRYLLLQVDSFFLGEREIYRRGLCEELEVEA